MILHLGDSLEVLKQFADNSIDACVTDPPYGLKFMNKHWDYDVPKVELWREVLRVLKPGAHLLSFGGTRTYHRMVVAIEDAGFEIRDQIQWIYGSGFPKSLDVSKAIDKAAGVEREKGWRPIAYKDSDCWGVPNKNESLGRTMFQNGSREMRSGMVETSYPSTDLAKRWQGFGTALKPANEPIVLARKPLEKGLTAAENVIKWGCGALNIDGSRIAYVSEADKKHNTDALKRFNSTSGNSGVFMMSKNIRPNVSRTSQGRWPANVLFDKAAAAALDEQSGMMRARGNKTAKQHIGDYEATSYKFGNRESGFAGDSGGASRFFYVAKASKRERNAGLEGETKEKQGARPNSKDMTGKFPDHDHRPTGGNNHPTVKPIKLMEYLCKLITPPSGTVLDPFMGSGSTGIAAKILGYKFVGIEMNAEYLEIATKRIENASQVTE